jgi:RNA-directed DNA polymerase
VQGTRRLTQRFDEWRAGDISFAEFDAGVQGWINHVRYADSWRLREHVLDRFVW